MSNDTAPNTGRRNTAPYTGPYCHSIPEMESVPPCQSSLVPVVKNPDRLHLPSIRPVTPLNRAVFLRPVYGLYTNRTARPGMKLHRFNIEILLFSCRETWIDVQEYLHINQDPKNNIENSSNPYFPAVELSVEGTFLTENDEPLINFINPIFNMIQITYLDIECDKMTVSMLITILHALINLNSIRLSNSSLRQQMDLNTRDKIIFSIFLKINKIRKITLLNITEIDQIEFIFKRFPRLQFFGLQRVWDSDLKASIQHILWNVKYNYISHPVTICVFCHDAKYNKVEELHQMIDSKNLLDNYTIHRQYDRFYVQWK